MTLETARSITGTDSLPNLVGKVTFADTPPTKMADILTDASNAALDLLLQLLLWNPGANPSRVLYLPVHYCAEQCQTIQ